MVTKYCNNCKSYVPLIIIPSIIGYDKQFVCPFCGGKNLSKFPP
jgi:DNA-directed RNA polymerase subunit RPC12/RpoP